MIVTAGVGIGRRPGAPAALPTGGVEPRSADTPVKAFWMYRNADDSVSSGPQIMGTPETLIMPSPQPAPDQKLVGVMHVHPPRNAAGYPLHISMMEKAFANAHGVTIYSGSAGRLWKYEAHARYASESSMSGAGREGFTIQGPYMGDGPMPQQYVQEGAAMKNALAEIPTLGAAQRDLANYVMLFVDARNAVWIEIAPLPAPGEALQLGCAMQRGRDMVFGYFKAGSANQTPTVLPCF